MNIVDLHCDTLSLLRYFRACGRTESFKDSPELQVTLDGLKKGGYMLQSFALFTDRQREEDRLSAALEMVDIFHRLMEDCSAEISQVFRYEDIEKNKREGKISALLTIEDSGCCSGNTALLRIMYDLGVRIGSLTWNYENEIAFPNLKPQNDMTGRGAPELHRGLKEKGLEYIAEMERIGMIIDVSHLGDKGFFDVAEHTTRPFIASHSNARKLNGNCRNLTDEMIRVLADRGGITGINFCPQFLDTGDIPGSKMQSTCAFMAEHMAYLRNKGGIDIIALGSDFDGIGKENLQMSSCAHLPMLISEMKKRGFSDDDTDKITHENALRILREFM